MSFYADVKKHIFTEHEQPHRNHTENMFCFVVVVSSWNDLNIYTIFVRETQI